MIRSRKAYFTLQIGPQTFRASQAPAYTGGVISMIVCYIVCAGLAGLYWVVSAAANKRRDAQVDDSATEAYDSTEPTDLTDFQQPGFRYIT